MLLRPRRCVTKGLSYSSLLCHSSSRSFATRILVVGQSPDGQLGNGKREAVITPSPLFEDSNADGNSLRGNSAAGVACASSTSFAWVTETKGRGLWAWGVANFKPRKRERASRPTMPDFPGSSPRTGEGLNFVARHKKTPQEEEKEESIPCWDTPTPLSPFHRLPPIKQVVSGRNHVLALTDDGVIHSLGSATQAGLGGPNDNTEEAKPIKIDKRIVHITTGYDHCAALSDDGKVFVWGDSVYHQLGFLNMYSHYSPQHLDVFGNREVTHIEAGLSHTVAVVENKELWAWGSNNRGQIALPGTYRLMGKPSPVEALQLTPGESLIQLACGLFHNLLLTDKGRLLFWGDSGLGVAALDAAKHERTNEPAPIDFSSIASSEAERRNILKSVKKMVCGPTHSILILNDGRVIVWGHSLDYQLGTGRRTVIHAPFILPLTGIIDAATGWGHSLFLQRL